MPRERVTSLSGMLPRWFPLAQVSVVAMSEAPYKKCIACESDTSFLAFVEGVCIPCGDQMQAMSKPELIRTVAASMIRLIRENEKLQKESSK